MQKAYRIVVSDGEGDVWDSGKVESDILSCTYSGKKLDSFSRYFWRVKIWDEDDRDSEDSVTAYFETAALDASDWRADWITRRKGETFSPELARKKVPEGPSGAISDQYLAFYLRKDFTVSEKPLKRARIYVSGLGCCEVRINGRRIGDHLLDPAQTDYSLSALYSAYDVTGYLNSGGNAVGIILGNGRHIGVYGYGKPKAIIQLLIEYEDGTKELISTDSEWKSAHGPIRENGIFFGEVYDARLEMPGWDQPGFDSSGWEDAEVVQGPSLRSQRIPPIRCSRELRPVELYSPESGVFIYDFGQVFTGWVRFSADGPEGTSIRLRHSEVVFDDGRLNVSINRKAEAADTFILSGHGRETFEPHFTYHGFRYVEVTGFPGAPTPDDAVGVFFHTDMKPVGSFHCSDQLVNRIHQITLWGQLSNFMSIPTDCPQRDERMGWMGDAQIVVEEAMYNFDAALAYRKFLADIRESQKDDGSIPDVVPAYWPFYPADPAWGTAFITIAWYHYLFYGDTCILAENYEGLKKYISFLDSKAENHIIKTLGKYGDWCPPASTMPKKTPVELTSTWYYYHDVFQMAKIADVLGEDKDRIRYSESAGKIKDAFNKYFLNGAQYATTRMSPIDKGAGQTSQTLPLYLDMVPEEQRAKGFDLLLATVEKTFDMHLDTGIIGTRYLFDVLTENGHVDAAFAVVTQKSYPGFGYMIREGATTVWERWEKLHGEGMNSQNHIMLGSVDAWFYRDLAGLSPLLPGWRKIRVKPHIPDRLSHCSARVETVVGEVSAAWERIDKGIALTIAVPFGCSAEVHFPLKGGISQIREGDKVVWREEQARVRDRDMLVDGLTGVETRDLYVVMTVRSGFYRFSGIVNGE
jgi:alpha-L-rhamnosidase